MHRPKECFWPNGLERLAVHADRPLKFFASCPTATGTAQEDISQRMLMSITSIDQESTATSFSVQSMSSTSMPRAMQQVSLQILLYLISTAVLRVSGFQPCNSKVLATHKVLVDSFRSIYPINNGTPHGSAIAVGRYPEDTYYNGTPWYLCTLAAAELIYDAVAQFNKSGHLTIDSTNQAFFKDIHPPAQVRISHR